MNIRIVAIAWAALVGLAFAATPASGPASKATSMPTSAAAGKAAPRTVVVFDFDTAGVKDDGTAATPLSQRPAGMQIADSVRLRLARHDDANVIDRISTQEAARPLPADADIAKITAAARKLLGSVALVGTVRIDGKATIADIRCIDLGDPSAGWRKTFRDETERANGVIAQAIVEAIRSQAEWVPPQYGDQAKPKNFGAPLNKNGDFEQGAIGWDRPDNVSTFIEPGPDGRGKILRVRTDLARDPWLAYQRQLRFGQADPTKPPTIARDTSYGCIGGLEGVHFRSELIPAKAGQRYWLLADCKGQGGAKVFVKGFSSKTGASMDGLPESSLVELELTAEQFVKLPNDKQKQLIEADSKKNPQRYLRECYRWYLNCADAKGQWKHLAAPFPPRGGLPENVEFLQIQIYSYWPPGEYLWDNVHLYAEPSQAAPQQEEKPRTPNATFGRAAVVSRIDNAQADAMLKQAQTYLQAGMKDEAIPILKRLIKEYPDSTAAQEAEKSLGVAK